jgi:hypothetical protein
MNKEQKINWVKCWLQKFGERDNETFSYPVEIFGSEWELLLQYNYDFSGDQLDPFCWCRSGFKHVGDNLLEDRSDDELGSIIDNLKLKKIHY